MRLAEKEKVIPFLVEEDAFEGVKRIADTVADDVCLVTGVKPAILSEKEWESGLHGQKAVLCATLGHSALLERLRETGALDVDKICGKREVFAIRLLEKPLPGIEELLVICGSDKRGTIYGMFTLSEYIGVTPLVFWGDAPVAKRQDIEIGPDIVCTAKEPSVRFRGFFINDEWPCFGSWVTSHFGDFNAEAYKYVFEFLLRMKGNYLWPAMWSASFPLDGPGSANEELADIYGVVMGYSHHEPCLRASEEWDKVRGEGSRYGNEWNFYTNEKGLTNYWEDALKRSGKYENIITIGMRGERDSSMLGENATVEENVSLLKRIIRTQRELIAKHVGDPAQVPQMLALYKEVEAYFYGDEQTEGLKDWEELEDVICMLCEDNFGHMRTLPTEQMRKRRGGFGMYYHLDYHGSPISYEWVDSTPLSKIWEQMCTAYEYGVRSLWIVNVGDLKLHEVPLTYFMALAYDFDKWGSSNLESYREFTGQWARNSFPEAEPVLWKKAGQVLTDYIALAGLRRPESLNADIYHPCHYLEADRMLKLAKETEALSCEVMAALPQQERDGYYSMVHFSALAFTNLLKLHLYAAKNRHYARQGRPVANEYAALARECIRRDRELAEEFAAFKDGKWSGMERAPHIGFTKWNEDGSHYPYLCELEPAKGQRLSVSRADEERVCVKNYGGPELIEVRDFLDAGCTSVLLEVANEGTGELAYTVKPQSGELPQWLEISPCEGTVSSLQRIELRCSRERLDKEEQRVRLLVEAGDAVVAVDVYGAAAPAEGLPEKTYLPRQGVLTIPAVGFCAARAVEAGAFCRLDGYGKYGSAMKVLPPTADFEGAAAAPELDYRFLLPQAGDYRVELLMTPTNSAVNHRAITLEVISGTGEQKTAVCVPETFLAGDPQDEAWCRGVLDQIRVASVQLSFAAGVGRLTVRAREAGVVLQRLRIYAASEKLPESYFGPGLSAINERSFA